MFSNRIASSIEIDASPSAVWQILMDFDAYPDWNPGMERVEGTPAVGQTLDVTFALDGGKTRTMHPTVQVSEPGRELAWLGRLWMPGIFDGAHAFRIEELRPGRVRFTQSESFRGLLVPFLRHMIEVDTISTFEAVNAALAERVATVRAERAS